jgi:hypothetical protein
VYSASRVSFAPIQAAFLTAMLFLISPTAPAQQSSVEPTKPDVTAEGDTSTLHAAPVHEDWSSIGLQGSTLVPAEPLLGQTENLPDKPFIRELYQLQWRAGDPIDLYVIRPKGVARPPVILYLYSYSSDTDRFKHSEEWCEHVTSGGYAAVGFVAAVTGHRFHDRPMKNWFVSELPEALATSTHDVQMIINYLSTRKDLDTSHLGMFGQGTGATIAALAAAADPRIKAVELLDPWGDWPDWLAKSTIIPEAERTKYVTPEFLASVAPLDPVHWLPKLADRRVHLEDVRGAYGIPEQSQAVIEAALPDTAELDQYGDSKAFFKAAAGKFFDWIKGAIGPGSDGKPVMAQADNRRVHPAAANDSSGSAQSTDLH